jgi:CheY-like chemotaxis protein
LVNARDAMPDGGDIEITTAVKTLTGESRPDETGTPLVPFITLRVADTGIGMPPPVLARAFEPFFSTKSHGSGVGLASVLEFARAHGGDACLDSLEAVGTSVYLYLPLCHRDGGVGNSDGHATPALVPPQPAAILVVEDEPYALEALVEILEADGHAVTAALNAGEALAALADRPYAVVLSDVILPDGSGLAVAAWADTHAPATEVVLMSGFVPSDEALRPHWRFVHKPLDIPQLRQVLAEALGAATLRAQSDRQATRSSAPSSG